MADLIIDLILAVILLIGMIVGYKRGFIASISVPIRRILSLLIAFGFAASFGEAVITPLLSEPITNIVADVL